MERKLFEHRLLIDHALHLAHEQLFHHLHQTRTEQRLGDEGINAYLACFLFDHRPIVSGKDDDRHCLIRCLANMLGSFKTAHARHAPIKDDHAIRIVIEPALDRFDACRTREAEFRLHANIVEQDAGTFAGNFIVVDDQDRDSFKIAQVFLLGIAQFHVNHNGEGGAFALFRFDIDRAAHKADHALYDSHAKARTFDLRGTRIVRARERLEEALHEFFAHAASGVAELELVARTGLDRARKLGDTQPDGAPFWRELDRVAHDVHEHLLQTGGIAQNMLVLDIDKLNFELLVLGCDLGVHHSDEVLDRLGEVEGLFCQIDRA